MSLYPDVQRRANTELDTVVGRGRLPDFADREKLPYVEAILKETLRWKAIDMAMNNTTNDSCVIIPPLYMSKPILTSLGGLSVPLRMTPPVAWTTNALNWVRWVRLKSMDVYRIALT